MDYKKDYYSILEVDSRATPEALRASYRRLAKLHHPDKNPGDVGAEDRFKSINEAYEVLSNEITRHIYDSLRTTNKKENQPQNPATKTHVAPQYEPLKTKKTRTYKVTREKRIYVQGTIEVKFQGDPELSDSYARKWEQRFTVTPTEVLITILSSGIYKDGPPKEYQLGYSSTDLFTTPLQQPINCKVLTGELEEYYQLDLYEIRVKDPKLKDITRHEQYSFGTLQGSVYAYVLYQYEEEITEDYMEYSGATGQVETKTEDGYIFTRQQFYAADGSVSWTAWKRGPRYTSQYQTYQRKSKTTYRGQAHHWSDWYWLIVLFILIVFWPRLLYIILPLAIGALLLMLFGWIISAFGRTFRSLGALTTILIVFFAIRSLFHMPRNTIRTVSNSRFDSIRTKRTIVPGKEEQSDTLITHDLRWEDRDSSRYDLEVTVSLSALHRSTAAHRQMNEQQFAAQDIAAVYHFLLEMDKDYTQPIGAAFDSLAKARLLNRQQTASMVVSCIQSIPYALVVDRSCSADYSDEYINQYKARCEGDCCKGFSKFGVQSPVEFIGDLKGDCDTRALLLYDILGKLGYRVALMTSNYYKHALIAVNLDKPPSDHAIAITINGAPYYLWETTSKGFGPGELPASLSDLNYWNIALTQ